MNKKLVLCLIGFALIFGSVRTEKEDEGNDDEKHEICKKTEMRNNFKSQVFFDYKQKSYHIEEIKLETRGKLIITENDKVTEIYYEEKKIEEKDGDKKEDGGKKEKKSLTVSIYDRSTNTCKKEVIVEKGYLTSARPYGFYNPNTGIFGPSAIWNIIMDKEHLTKFKFQGEQPERSVNAHVCEADLSDFSELKNPKIKLYISDENWRFFDLKKNDNGHQLLRLDIDASSTIGDDSDPNHPFKAVIRYLTFETSSDDKPDMNLHDFDKSEDFWITPSVCEPLVNDTPKIEIAEKIKMVVDEIDEIKLEKEEKEKKEIASQEGNGNKESEDNKDKDKNLIDLNLKRKKIHLDIEKNIKRFEDNEGQIKIYEDKTGQEFERLNDFTCKIEYNKKSQESKQLVEIIEDLFETDKKEYNFVGNKLIRNILTDVFRKFVHNKENKETIEATTLFLQQIDDKKDKTTRDPVWIRYEKFVKNGDSFEKEVSLLYDLYDFEFIETNDELVKIFDLSDCVHSEFEEDFNIVAPLKKKDDEEKKLVKLDDEKKEEEINFDPVVFKEDLREELVKAVGGSVLNFPIIEVKGYATEIISRIKFIGTVNPLAYFEDPTEEFEENKDLEVESPEEGTVKSIYMCARFALIHKIGEKKENAKGFQYCRGDKFQDGHYCAVIKPEDKAVKYKGEHCKEMVKHEKLGNFEYYDFHEQMKNLIKKIRAKEFIVEHNDQKIIAENLVRIKSEEKIDRSNLFEEKEELKKKKFIESETKKKLEYEDGIRNLETCYEACVDPKNEFDCDSFTFCSRFDNELFDCQLGSMFSEADKSQRKDFKDFFEDDDECNTYLVSSLNHFKEHTNKKLKEEDKETKTGAVILQKYDETDGNECALFCLNRNRESSDAADHCSTIEVCNEDSKPTCRLSSTQTLWDDEKTMGPNDNCNVFSVKHILNFHSVGKEKIYNFVEEKKDTLDACATACDSVIGCDKFNFCQQETNNKCRYLTTQDDKVKKDTALDSEELGCVTYVHRNKLIGAPQPKKEIIEKEINDGTGFKSGSTVGFIFLALFIGLVLGGIAFYGKKAYLDKRGGDQSGENNVAVNFSNLRDDL